MKKFTILLLCVLFTKASLYSQNTFAKKLGTNYNSFCYDMIATRDSGFAFVGRGDSINSSNSHSYFIKTDIEGNIQWSKKISNLSEKITAKAIAQTIDGGYVITGEYSINSNSQNECLYIKYDSLGNLISVKGIGGIYTEEGRDIIGTSDGGCIITCLTSSYGTNSSAMIIKLNNLGTIQWSKSFGSSNYEEINSICQSSDGGYVLCGLTQDSIQNPFIIKLSSTGTISWSKKFNFGVNARLMNIIPHTSGGFAATGQALQINGWELITMKINNLGSQEWVTSTGLAANYNGNRILEIANGNLLVCGDNMNNGYIGKYSSSGALIWQKSIGNSSFTNSITSAGLSVLPDSTITFAGSAFIIGDNRKFLFAKLNSTGANCITSNLTTTYSSPTISSSTFGAITTITPSITSGGNESSGAISGIICEGCGMNISLTASDSTICTGTSINIAAVVSGGISPYTYLWQPGGYTTNSINVNPIFSTTYTAYITDGTNNCTQNKSLPILTGPLNSLSVDDTLCKGHFTTITSDGYGTGLYNWNTGETSTSITVAPETTTTYSLTVDGAFGCTYTYPITITVDDCGYLSQFCSSWRASNFSSGLGIKSLNDGGYVACGTYGEEALIMKFDANQNLVWKNIIGKQNFGGAMQELRNVIEDSRGNYIAFGVYENSFDTDPDGYLISYNRAGQVVWRKKYDHNFPSGLRDVIETNDNGYLAVGGGGTSGDFHSVLIKTDSVGEIIWLKRIDLPSCLNTEGIQFEKILPQQDNGFILAGYQACFGNGNDDFTIVKVDSLGVPQWQKSYGTPNDEFLYDAINTNDNGIAMVGISGGNVGEAGNLLIVKIDSLFNVSWSKDIGNNHPNNSDEGMTLVQQNDGSIAAAGFLFNTTSLINEPWILHFDNNGNLDWSKIIPKTNYLNYFHGLDKTNDGGLIAIGVEHFDAINDYYGWQLTKFDALGNSCCGINVIPANNSNANIILTTQGNVTASITNFVSDNTLNIINSGFYRFDECNTVDITEHKLNDKLAPIIYPNPNNGEFTIEGNNIEYIEIYNILGESIYKDNTKSNGITSKKIILRSINSGFYFVTIKTKEGMESIKIIIN